jgi:hypothetical protein
MIRRAPLVGIAAGLLVLITAPAASAAATIAANSGVVTNTIKNAFLVQPSSPPATK